MKVLHILNSRVFSGAEIVVCQIINHFSETNDCEMAYCSPYSYVVDEALKSRGVKYYPLEKMSVKNIKEVIDEFKPDIIHAHDFKASFYSSFFANNVPFISHIHCNPTWLRKLSINTLLFKYYSKKAKYILGVSNSIIDEYKYRESIKNIFINISNPFDSNEIIGKSNEYNYESSFDLCYSGRLTEEKNPMKFLQVVLSVKEQIDNVKAVVIGDGVLKPDMLDFIYHNNLNDNVTMLGYVSNPFPIVKKCKVLCSTSNYEGFGLSILEAMSLGKPVVCSSVGGVKNIVDDNVGKLCSSDSISDYSLEITRLLIDKAYYSSKTRNAALKAKTFDNLDEYFNKLLNIYIGIVNEQQ